MEEKIKCSKGDGHLTSHLCRTCNKLLCMDCALTHGLICKSEEIIPLATLASQIAESLQGNIRLFPEIEREIERLNLEQKNIQKGHTENIKYFEDIVAGVRRSADTMIKLSNSYKDTLEKRLKEVEKLIGQEKESQREQQVLYKSFLNNFNNSDFYKVTVEKSAVENFIFLRQKNIKEITSNLKETDMLISIFANASRNLDFLSIKMEEKSAEMEAVISTVLKFKIEAEDYRQQSLQQKAKKHILLRKLKEGQLRIEETFKEAHKKLGEAYQQLDRLMSYEKYIDEENFSLLADSMISGTHTSEIVFKKLAPYIRTSKQATKLVFSGIKTFENGTYCGYSNASTHRREGKGVMVYIDGRIYEGLWKNDLPWGSGRWILPSGNVYEGPIYKGRFHGYGKYIWKSGETYLGEMDRGRRQGFGMYLAKNYLYLGQWEEDAMHGYGIKAWNDGDIYIGEFRKDSREGSGIFIWENGDKYIGEWYNNAKAGEGKHYSTPSASK